LTFYVLCAHTEKKSENESLAAEWLAAFALVLSVMIGRVQVRQRQTRLDSKANKKKTTLAEWPKFIG